jgi:hypothetical protein
MSHAALQAEADEIRRTGALGRSEPVRRLFDYLVQSSLEDRSPKEAEVAGEVFNRRADFDTSQDAVVRVYVHKLRRKLEAIYAGPRADSVHRLAIPRGEYRLVVEHQPETVVAAPVVIQAARRPWLLALAAVALVMVSSGATWLAIQAARPPAVRELEKVRAGPVWSPLLSNRFPTLVVVGDYYIFGESDDGMQVNRLVREYSVNSQGELDDFLMAHPNKVSHYIDLDLRYLPVGAAYALRDVLPVVATAAKAGPVKVILASDLTPGMLKTNNIVYIGYFSAMGVLRDAVFAGSRFSVGDTYDDLIDDRTQHHYSSQGGGPDSNGAMYVDYGYVSTFKGPAGNRVVVVAGTRDVALMQAADAATGSASVRQMVQTGHSPDAFEALFEAQGMSRLNVAGKLLTASPLDVGKIWNGSGGKVYPAG